MINAENKVTLIGDKSLSKRDFSRVTLPLKKFGASFKSSSKKLPLVMKGIERPLAIKYREKKAPLNVKSSVIFAALKADGETKIKARKSRDHTELLLKYLRVPIKVKKINFMI